MHNLNIKIKHSRALVRRLGWQCQRNKAFSPEGLFFKDLKLNSSI